MEQIQLAAFVMVIAAVVMVITAVVSFIEWNRVRKIK